NEKSNASLDLSNVEGVTPREGTANPQEGERNETGESLIDGMNEEGTEEAVIEAPVEKAPASKEAESTPEKGDEFSVQNVADLYLAVSGEQMPSISPELTTEEKEGMSEEYIDQYDTKRRLEMVEGKDFYREKMGQGQTVVNLIEEYTKIYSNDQYTITPQEVFTHMKTKFILSPEDAVKSLVFDHAQDVAKNQGASDALKKATPPVNPAKSVATRGRPVGSNKPYNDESDAH
ncbi:unnamed protein product, partial [marine sediment metagenome]